MVVDVARSARHADNGALKVMGSFSQPYNYHISKLLVGVRATLNLTPHRTLPSETVAHQHQRPLSPKSKRKMYPILPKRQG